MATSAISEQPAPAAVAEEATPRVEVVDQHIVEFISDSGEGAQTAGQMFGTVSAKMGNGVWTLEIIPAEIEPPFRSRAGASGNRIRIGTEQMTNMGETANVVVAFNDQVPYSRIDVDALAPGSMIFLESKWATDDDPKIRQQYVDAIADFKERGYVVYEVPMEEECLKIVADARRGKNMWALGMVCAIYERDHERILGEIEHKFKRKGEQVVKANLNLIEAGVQYAEEHVPVRFRVPVKESTEQMVVMNGNRAVAEGIMAAGIEVCSMYPITPATSVSHYLANAFPKVGGFIHQAEDEIAAIGFALGVSYAGKTPVTVTSGPGLALKTEFVALGVMAELPLVIVVVQRGGPSTGLPTRVEQGDLLASVFGQPGDAPKIVMAASTIDECFHLVITARKLAETFRTPVVLLTDANLATGQTRFPRPVVQEEWMSPPIDQSDWDPAVPPYDWDPVTGMSQRPIPGQRDGMYTLTGLAHDEDSRVAYVSEINQRAMERRSRKLATVRRTLKPPEIFGDPEGDLLVVCWGSTRGAIEEAAAKLRREGAKISVLTLRFLSPLEPGLKEIFSRFNKVMTVEINYSDEAEDEYFGSEGRRYAQLATLLRSATLVDVDCWSRVPGSPLSPDRIEKWLRQRLGM